MSLVVKPSSCLFVLSGPCGTGKTSLALAWLEAEGDMLYTRSVTTRRPRQGTVENYDYISRDQFAARVERGEFVQWIHPSYDEYYGTRRAPIEEAIANGQDMVFDYCPEGYLNLRRAFPDHVVGIFLMAPTVEAMEKRLEGRGTEREAELKLRHRMALADFNFVDQHRYHVINDDFDQTLVQLRAIRVAEKARLARQRAVLDTYAHHARPALLRYYDAADSCNK